MRAAYCSAEWMDEPGKNRLYLYYGYRDMRFKQMLCLIQQVHWPEMSLELVMSTGKSLSPLEQCLFAKMWLWVCGGRVPMQRLADQWSIHQRTACRYVEVWAPRWGKVGRRYSRLLVDPQYLLLSQPVEFADRYSKPISHIPDGCVFATEVPRTSSLRAHLLYNDKIKHQGVLGIDLVTPIGLCVRDGDDNTTTTTTSNNVVLITLCIRHRSMYTVYAPLLW